MEKQRIFTGTANISQTDSDYITIITLNNAGVKTDISNWIVIDDINGNYSLPEIRVYN